MKNTFQYSLRALGVIYTDCRGSGRGLSRGVRLMSYSAVPYYLKLNRSMGVGPCEWSEVNTNAATKEGFLMNTLRRISRPLVKTFAVGAVMVAAALPAMALSGTASAATTAPTIVCTNAATVAPGACASGYAIVGQGFAGNFVAGGTDFAFDQAVGGAVTLTTTAPGVTFTNVMETSATALTADISTTSATTPGFYPVTLTDDNGTTTFAVGLGVDNGPQVATVAGNAGTVGGAASTVSVTGTFLNNSTVSIEPIAGDVAPTVGATTLSNSGTTLSFTVSQPTGTTPAAYTVLITSTWPTGALGSTTTTYTVNGAPTVVSITGVTPNELGIPVTNPSTQTVTISGTGFELGAILTITPNPADAAVTIADPTFVNSTTMTAQITVGTAAIAGELNVTVVNPDTSNVSGTGLIGIGQAPTNTAAGPAAPVAPALGAVSGFLAPGTASVIQVTGTSTFPITTGSTVGVARAGVTNVSESLTGTVTAVASATNTATILVKVPRYATTTTTAAVAIAGTTLSLTDASGITNGATTATVIDGASTEQLAGTLAGNTFTVTTLDGARFAHAAGVTVEFPFPAAAGPAGIANTLTINNGTNKETSTPVPVDISVAASAYPYSTYTASTTGATLATLDPGTYSINAYLPGFGFTTGAAVSFQSFSGAAPGTPDNDGVTGTVTVVNGNTATLAVTVPAVRSGDTGDHLTVGASPGQNAITLSSVVNSSVAGSPNILVGDSITIEPDSFYLTPETVKVTSVDATTGVVGITPALADSHTGGAAGVGAEVVDNSDPQSINDRVQATILSGGGLVEVDPTFFGFTTGGAITSTTLATPGAAVGDVGVAPFGTVNSVGAGASGATVNLLLSQGTDGSAPADWTGSSTNTAVTFGPITNDTGTNITTTINVAAGTAPTTGVPISFTDGLETYAGTIAIVAGPTISAVTAVGNLTGGSAGFTVGVTGTNFVPGTGAVNALSTNMICSTSDPAVTCNTLVELTDSSTTATVEILPGPTMLNGTDSITLTDAGSVDVSGGAANVPNYGAATLAGAFTVSGQPTVTSISPTVIPFGTAPTITATGTLFPTSGTAACSYVVTTPLGVAAAPAACVDTLVSATSATIAGYSAAIAAGDTVVFTFGNTVSEASTSAVTVQSDPVTDYIVTGSVLSNFYKTNGAGGDTAEGVAAGSTAVPFHIVGTGFLASATVTLASAAAGGTGGTATVTSVTPNGIFGTLTIPATATVGLEDATVTNANGGSTTFDNLFTVTAAPTIVTPSVAVPKAILDGTASSITITGTGFVAGAVVTGAVAGVDTFGTAVVSNSALATDKCTGFTATPGTLDTCNTITVPVTPVSFSGSTPILDGLVVTNPLGGGSVTLSNDITVNPVPAVTGTYYVPTFTSNAEVTINGSGFESGITASSANPDYTVLAVASTATTVTLLVSTDSNATTGTSSTITLTNPDGGSGTFPLNGGPNPNTVTPTPKAIRTVGVVHTGKTSTVRVVGTHFYGQPKVTSNDKGTTVRTVGDTGKILTLKVTTKSTTKHGVHTFIIRFANGEQTSVKYNDAK